MRERKLTCVDQANERLEEEGDPVTPYVYPISGLEPGHADADSAVRFLRFLQTEIIPRLMLVHRVADKSYDEPLRRPIEKDVSEFSRLLAQESLEQAKHFVRALISQGISVETIFMDVFAPAARQIGKHWEDDRLTFTEVTIALSRLQCLVRELGVTSDPFTGQWKHDRIVALSPAPGEQHILGILLVEELLRRAGWEVLCETSTTIVELVRTSTVAVVGFTASDAKRIDALTDLIRKVRAASRNPKLFVMVGGPCFANNRELVKRVGADATAADAREAVRTVHNYLETAPAKEDIRPEDRARKLGPRATPFESRRPKNPWLRRLTAPWRSNPKSPAGR